MSQDLSPPPPPSRPGLSPPACPGWLGQRSGLAAGQSSSAITTEADLPLGGPGVRARSRTAMCPGSRVTLDGRRADLPPGLGCAWQTQARAGEPDFKGCSEAVTKPAVSDVPGSVLQGGRGRSLGRVLAWGRGGAHPGSRGPLLGRRLCPGTCSQSGLGQRLAALLTRTCCLLTGHEAQLTHVSLSFLSVRNCVRWG